MVQDVDMDSNVKEKEVEEYWCVEGSDDEKYDPSKSGKGLWEPSADDILKLFEKLEKNKILDIKWKCPGRKPPNSEIEKDRKIVETEEKEEEISMEEEKKPEQPTEFDFDDDEFGDMSNPITPRRTPGGKTPKSQKKVATMDKVLKNIMIERKQAALQKEARKLAKSPRTPQGTPRPRLGTPPAASNIGQNQHRGTPLRPPTVSEAAPIRNLMASSVSDTNPNGPPETKDAQTPGNISAENLSKFEQKTEDKVS
ncbi:PA1 [Mytilus edulis]|uniref:PA1 n=1 Tax=Mytilus edulis TaxID=6550 RepID=A0A8S3SKD8_MYTED|nr:PA1 [Mytilus edulis]